MLPQMSAPGLGLAFQPRRRAARNLPLLKLLPGERRVQLLDIISQRILGGNAGFTDQVDNHWWRVITGIALGSILAAGVVVPQGNVTGYVPTIGQGMAVNAAGAVNQAGQQITSRALNIQPTIKIRPGFSVNVLVTKDLVLDPYR